jgi:phage I-like protein
MSALAFDTHRTVKRLQMAGFTEEQAEALTTAVQDAAAVDVSRLATKDQVAALDAKTTALDAKVDALDTKIDLTAARLEERIDRRGAESDARMVRWVVTTGVGAVMATGGMLAGAVAFLMHALPMPHP